MTDQEMIRISCPGCGAKHKKPISKDFIGRKGHCPACQTLFVVDDPPRVVKLGPGLKPVEKSEDPDATRLVASVQMKATDPEATCLTSPPEQPADDSDLTQLPPSVLPIEPLPQIKPAEVSAQMNAEASDPTQRAVPSSPLDGDLEATRLTAPDEPAAAPVVTGETVRAISGADDSGRKEEVPLVWHPGDRFLETYRVDEILGQGAFGTVYRVRHLGWNMDLAVKTPNPETLDAHGAEIFTGEAETWSELGLHPHIVSCYYVRDLGGVPRVFAEYVDGGSLQEWIEHGKVEGLERKLDIAIQFAWGLAYAHARNMVHKDVKPANVMLTADGRVKVTDFGLTRAKGGPGGAGEVDIGGGRTMMVDGAGCTPAYASPEQMAGQMVSRAADAWSWAVSILAMFTGGARWRVGVAAPTILEELSQRADGDKPMMPKALAGLLRDCFVLEPEQRLRDMNEVADRLMTVYQEVAGKQYSRSAPRMDQALSADSLVNRALSKIDLGRRDQAATLLEEALALQPHHPEATYNLGLLRWRAGEISDMDLVLELEEVRSTHTRTWIDELCLGLVHMERSDFATAIKVLGSIQDEEGKNNPQVLEALQKSRERMTATSEQIAHWGQWGQKPPESPGSKSAFSGNRKRMIFTYSNAFVIFDVSSGKVLQAFENQKSGDLPVDLNRDGSLAAIGSHDQTIQLWDVAAGSCQKVFRGHIQTSFGGINDVRISKDATKIYSCGSDKTIREWDIASETCLRTLTIPGQVIRSMDLTPDETTLITGEQDGSIGVWDLPSGENRNYLKSRNVTLKVRISPDGRSVLASAMDGYLRSFNVDDPEPRWERKAYRHGIHHMDVDKRSMFAATGGKHDTPLKLWFLETGRCLRTYESPAAGHGNRDIHGIRLCTPEQHIPLEIHEFYHSIYDMFHVKYRYDPIPAAWLVCRVMGSEVIGMAATVYEAEMNKAEQAYKMLNYSSALHHLVRARKQIGFERAPQTISLSKRLSLRLPRRALRGGWQSFNLKAHERQISAIAVSPDGSYLATGAQIIGDAAIKIWDVQTGKCLREIDERSAAVYELAITTDGRHLVSSFLLKPIAVWNAQTGQIVRRLENNSKSIQNIRLSPDNRFVYGKYINTYEKRYFVGMWDIETGKCIRTIDFEKFVLGMNVTSDGSRLGYFVDKFHLWDPGSGLPCAGFNLWPRPLHLFFAPGNQMICYSGDGYITCFDINAGKSLRQGKGFGGGGYYQMRVLADWRHALVTNFRNIEFADIRTMELDRTFEGHQNDVTALAVSRQGHFIASGDMAGNLRIWHLDWELEPMEPCFWDDSAEPWLRDFLALHRPRAGDLPKDRAPTEQELNAYFHHAGRPVWNDDEFNRLISDLQCAGLGYIRPEGIRSKLEEMASKM